MAGSTGTFKWKIESRLLTKILNAKNGDEWPSDTFTISNLQFTLDVSANTDGAKNSFQCFVTLKPWPSGTESIVLCVSQFCKETMMSHTFIDTFTENDNSLGLPDNKLLMSELNKNMKSLTIGARINILAINYKQSSLYFNKILSNINNKYRWFNKYKLYISWNINNKLLTQWKCAHIGKSFESETFDNQWVITCYPNGENEDCEGFLSAYIQLCGLPTTIKQIKVKYKIKCIQTNDEWGDTADFSYDITYDGTVKFMKSTKMNAYSSLKLIATIDIIEAKRNINQINQQTNILNAKIVSLTKDISHLQRDTDEVRKQNKSQIELLKNENKKLKQNIKTLLRLQQNDKNDIDELRKENNSLTKENNKVRFVAATLKRIAQHLQPARLSDIEWTKTFSFKQLTIRSLSVQTYRIKIQQQAKYAKLQRGQYCVENNPYDNYKYMQTEDTLKLINKFVERNHIGNANPNIEYKKNKCLSMEKILSTRNIKECKHLPLLIGQRETYTNVNIGNGVIIGQYVGSELLQEEYLNIYNGTTDELDHLTFMHSDILTLANGETVEIYIDAFAANKSSPLLYINDGRKDMRNKDKLSSDEKRINTEFVMVLVNGWPMILIRTTKKIKKDASLWIHYGDRYGLVLDEKALIYDQRKKAMRSVEEIWGFYVGNNSNSDEPFDITLFDDDELQNNHNKKRSLIMAEDDNSNNNNHNTNNSSSPRKKQRVR